MTDAKSCIPPTMREPYCAGCGHDATRHRSGRCWTGAMGEPLARTRSLIACTCDTYQEET